ncbi:LysR family transcriptional regulator [Polaromonas sp.]|uniref:LysR family transcriptional regulator n=1 Tax=Polaromonas sp. TaxID=1869339 RepID=UPI001850159C|nr:LysR family transcriptional regulator [Polaromonas sp.]NMM04711.1 LysR family transcriptional regulator [Polaromonas sp.]
MDRFLEMQTFTAVVDAGSFVRAAETLDMSKAAVSRYVAELEARLGVRLLHRTTRKLSLTEEGRAFHARCKAILGELDEAESVITARSAQASGLVKINVPVTFGNLHLAPLWSDFMTQNPRVTLDVTLNDRVVDLVEEGYDMAVRIGTLPSSSLISKKLASTRMVLCASPAYLKEHDQPEHPSDLARHAVLAYSLLATGEQWGFDGPDGRQTVVVNPVLRTNSGDTCRAAALKHHGIILQPTFMVGEDLRSGALVELMPQYRSSEFGIYAVYPSRRYMSAKVRLLIEFLAKALGNANWCAS